MRSRLKFILFPGVLLCSLTILYFRVQLRLDALHYYEPLRSLVFDGDLNTYNEREYVTNRTWNGLRVDRKPLFTAKTKFLGFMQHPDFTSQGYSYAFFPIGWSFFMAPGLVISDLFIRAANFCGAIAPSDGYNYPYLLMLSLQSYFYGAFGLVLAYKFCTGKYGAAAALFGFCSVILVHNVIPYLAIDSLYSHAPSLFLISAYFYLWNEIRNGRWRYLPFGLGLVGGLLPVLRYQDISLLILPALDLVIAVITHRSLRNELRIFGLFLLGLIPSTLMQSIYWKILHGMFIIDRVAMGTGEIPTFNPFKPQILAILFSNQQGLLSWTPFMALSLLGFIPLIVRYHRLGSYVMLQFLIQTYYNSSRSEWWNLGYGIRRYSNYAILFMLGFTALYSLTKLRLLKIILITLVVIGGLWNLTFMAHYYDSDYINLHGPYFPDIVGGLVPYQFFEYRIVYPPMAKLMAIVSSGMESLFKRSEVLVLLQDICSKLRPQASVKLVVILLGLSTATALAFLPCRLRPIRIPDHPVMIAFALLPLGFATWLLVSGLTTQRSTAFIPDRADNRLNAHSIALHRAGLFVGMNKSFTLPPSSEITISPPTQTVSRIQCVLFAQNLYKTPSDSTLSIELSFDGRRDRQLVFDEGELLNQRGLHPNLIPIEPDFSANLTVLDRTISSGAVDTIIIKNDTDFEIMLLGILLQ